MASKGAGAKAAWLVGSRVVLADLERIFAGESVQRVDFEAGESARGRALSAYERARRSNGVAIERFPDIRRLHFAASQSLATRFPDEVYVFLQDSERKGVFSAATQAVAKRAANLLEYDGSCVYVSSLDGLRGVLLDYEADRPGDNPYELESWG